MHHDSFLTKVQGPFPVLASGNTTSPYCRADMNHNSQADKLLIIPEPRKIPTAMTQENSTVDSFEITLGQAYYNQGFFNIRVKHSDKIGADKENITVNLGDIKTITGYINRTANSNKTPRIMCGKEYTNWIKSNFRQKDNLIVDILSTHSIRLNFKKTNAQHGRCYEKHCPEVL